jgi:hypothetical protein
MTRHPRKIQPNPAKRAEAGALVRALMEDSMTTSS